MKKIDKFDFWYAVNNTEVILLPAHHLETFGMTVLNYHLVSELMDDASQVRVREGRMQASKPQIVTPQDYSNFLMEGFGDEAERYMNWLKDHENDIKILQYGYTLKQESFSEHVITDSVEAVVEKIKLKIEKSGDPLSAVVVGVDSPWDVCLVKLFWEIIQKSAGPNMHELTRQNIMDNSGRTPASVKRQIEEGFLAASRNPDLIKELAALLQKHGLMDSFQDRFFSLVKSGKKR